MPLRDHFSPPLSRERHWESFHGAWAGEIARSLNLSILPDRFVAEPLVRWGSRVEIDVATQDRGAEADAGGIALQIYAPPQAPLKLAVDWSDQRVFEIQVQREEGGLRLVAAIELVSPANKDRPSHRAAFVRKCASYLHQGVAVVVVDIVTERAANLHADLMSLLGDKRPAGSEQLFAASYRVLPREADSLLEAWPTTLTLGGDLPTVPLWLDFDLAVPLDLDETYRSACDALRIH